MQNVAAISRRSAAVVLLAVPPPGSRSRTAEVHPAHAQPQRLSSRPSAIGDHVMPGDEVADARSEGDPHCSCHHPLPRQKHRSLAGGAPAGHRRPADLRRPPGRGAPARGGGHLLALPHRPGDAGHGRAGTRRGGASGGAVAPRAGVTGSPRHEPVVGARAVLSKAVSTVEFAAAA
jgi:hypothetical protein